MKTIISPAKNMKTIENISKPLKNINPKTKKLYNILNKLSPDDISVYMKVNNEIALKTFIYYKNINFNYKGTPAIFSYNGIQYKNIETEKLTKEDIIFASKNIKIISAFYGLLDADTPIQPYRLEMAFKFKNIFEIKDLYKFWGNTIYNKLFEYNEAVINLASDEYSKTITPFLNNNNKFINIKFMRYYKGKYKTFATDAKISRGKMIKFIINNKIEDVNDLKFFKENDYEFMNRISNNNNFIFYKKIKNSLNL